MPPPSIRLAFLEKIFLMWERSVRALELLQRCHTPSPHCPAHRKPAWGSQRIFRACYMAATANGSCAICKQRREQPWDCLILLEHTDSGQERRQSLFQVPSVFHLREKEACLSFTGAGNVCESLLGELPGLHRTLLT